MLSLNQSLFDLTAGAAETKNVASANPDVVKHLLALADKALRELGDTIKAAIAPAQR